MKIKFNLLGNAIDSIERGIELIAWKAESGDARRGDARRLKQAVLSVAHGVELLLKERLRRVHPVLIWENVDKFPSLSARTVTVDIAIGRLEKIGGITLSRADSDLIRSLRDTRNAIEHYAWTTTKDEAEQIIGEALGFAIHFAKEELAHNFFGYETQRDGTFQTLLEESPKFAASFHSRYQQQGLVRSKMICSHCHAKSVNSSTGACDLCGHWNETLFGSGIPEMDDDPF